MKLKLIDIETDTHVTTFGTCERCFSYGTVDEPVYVFQKETGEQFEIEGYWWDWGDYLEICVDNAILFADYIGSQEFSEDTLFNYSWLNQLVDDYYELQEVTADE